MTNEETQLEGLENLTNEQLEAKVKEAEAAEADELEANKSNDVEAKLKAAENRNAMLQRLLNKKDKTITKTTDNGVSEISKDIAEIKFINKVNSFAEDNGLTIAQAKKLFEIQPNATAETLKDPFIAKGLEAIGRKDRVERATPGSTRVGVVNGKSFKEMTREERIANFDKVMGN